MVKVSRAPREHKGLDLSAQEDEIRRCVSLCKSAGIRLVDLELGLTDQHLKNGGHPHRVCVLGAVAWIHRGQRQVQQHWYALARKVLTINHAQADELMRGFDGFLSKRRKAPMYHLGQRLRHELLECQPSTDQEGSDATP